ncbi:glycosyltransferase [Paenibacillus tarimensis]
MMKNILILSEAFGSGHTKAAEALAQGLSLQDPSVHTEIIEIGKKLHPVTSSLVLHAYKHLIRLFPNFWRRVYRNLSKHKATSYWLQFLLYQLFHRNIEHVLEQKKPDLVICTHPFISSSLSRLKRMGQHPLKFCTVITDFHAHRVWIQHEVDHYLVSNEEVRRQLIETGISKRRISITGIPVQPHFWTKNNKKHARSALSLKNMPTVIIMGGGFGLGGIKELAFSLSKWKENVQLLICTGYNFSLKNSLERDEFIQHPHIRVMGFVDHIDLLMDAADLLITKPGGLTCFEALRKGVPMLIYQPIPGHEEYNSDHLVKHGLAIRIHHRKEADEWIEKLLFYPESFEPYYKNIDQFQQQMKPLAGAETILNLLEQKKYGKRSRAHL